MRFSGIMNPTKQKCIPGIFEYNSSTNFGTIDYYLIASEELEFLATDKNSVVREDVANNPNTPHYIKKYLKIQEQLSRL